MCKYKKVSLGLLASLMIFNVTVSGEAAETPDKTKSTKNDSTAKQSSAPIVIEAEELYFSDSTGNLSAKGNVQIIQNNQKITAQELQGNTKRTEVWIEDKATFNDPTAAANITGIKSRYNYGNQTGTMLSASGTVGRQKVAANHIDILPQEFILHNGTMTMCPAKVPDYHISADKVEIWPGNKMIAYNAKLWIKDKVILSMNKYQKSLDKNSESEFPQIGYTSSDGFYIKQYLEYPLSDKVAMFGHPAYFSKHGFKPTYGFINRENRYTVTLMQGETTDTDGNWIKKEPELRLDYAPRKLGNLPVSYTFTGIYGKWTDKEKTSWHQNYILYFTREPIKLSQTLTLTMGTGYEIRKESYDGSTVGTWRFNTGIHKVWSPTFSTFANYNYTQNNTTLFNYNHTNVGKELIYGFSYQIDRLNAFSFHQSYDLENTKVYENYYTWNRNLHCWQMSLQYKAKEKKLEWNLSVTRW